MFRVPNYTHYHLTDHQFSTVALIDNAARLIERVSYDAYGRSRHHWAGDITGDGAVNTADQTAMSNAHRKSIGHADYNVDADVTRTGTVNNDDLEWTVIANFDGALPDGALSAHGNTVGYAGYIFNAEVPGGGGLYTVRYRHYDPALGRWLERDPLGYVDGLSLYGYVQSNAVNAFDPFGLCSHDFVTPYRNPDYGYSPPTEEEQTTNSKDKGKGTKKKRSPGSDYNWDPVGEYNAARQQAARETRELVETILEWEMWLFKEIAFTVATGGAGSIVGRAAGSVLARYGPRAVAAISKLGKGAHEGVQQTIAGGIVVAWIGGEWVIIKVLTDHRFAGAAVGILESRVPGHQIAPDGMPNDFERGRNWGNRIGDAFEIWDRFIKPLFGIVDRRNSEDNEWRLSPSWYRLAEGSEVVET